ncbi:MAG TPA: SRPBCC domain-containing protein, partial [Chitinophagaceae bacterium]|nr:SRPBCC domain-containing protein [Chitinophagaceae bacterium]
MIPNLLFDFTVDKATATIHITREFAADLDLVWDAWTKAEMLDQWMGPKPWRAQTKEMDFREGGRWLYAMISPENVAARWILVEFVKIQPRSSFTTKNSFCDENGSPTNTGFTWSLTTNSFKAGAGITTVQIVKKMANLSELEQFVAMGYKEGMAMVMRNLDEYLLTLVTNK